MSCQEWLNGVTKYHENWVRKHSTKNSLVETKTNLWFFLVPNKMTMAMLCKSRSTSDGWCHINSRNMRHVRSSNTIQLTSELRPFYFLLSSHQETNSSHLNIFPLILATSNVRYRGRQMPLHSWVSNLAEIQKHGGREKNMNASNILRTEYMRRRE
jgi:hypothetical protein